VIEEIFSGGDGFGGRRDDRAAGTGGSGSAGAGAGYPGRTSELHHHHHRRQRSGGDTGGYWSDGEMRSGAAAGVVGGGGPGAGDKSAWPDFGGYAKRVGGGGIGGGASRERLPGSGGDEVFRSSGAMGRASRGSFGAAAGHAADLDKGWAAGSVPEVDELDERDDLRCWNSRI
jgi:hypothetical protein